MTSSLAEFLVQIGAGELGSTVILPKDGIKPPLAALHDRLQTEIDSIVDETRVTLEQNWPEFEVQSVTSKDLLRRMYDEQTEVETLEDEMNGKNAFLPELIATLTAHAELVRAHSHSSRTLECLTSILDFHASITQLSSYITTGDYPSAITALFNVKRMSEGMTELWIKETEAWRALKKWMEDEEDRLEVALIEAFDGCFIFSTSEGPTAKLLIQRGVVSRSSGQLIPTVVILESLDQLLKAGSVSKSIDQHIAKVAKQLLSYFIFPILASSRTLAYQMSYNDSQGESTIILMPAKDNEGLDVHGTVLPDLERLLTFFALHSNLMQHPTYSRIFSAHLTPPLQSFIVSQCLQPRLPNSILGLGAYIPLLTLASTFESTFLSSAAYLSFLPTSAVGGDAYIISAWIARVDVHWAKRVGDGILERVRSEISKEDWEADVVEVFVEEEAEEEIAEIQLPPIRQPSPPPPPAPVRLPTPPPIHIPVAVIPTPAPFTSLRKAAVLSTPSAPITIDSSLFSDLSPTLEATDLFDHHAQEADLFQNIEPPVVEEESPLTIVSSRIDDDTYEPMYTEPTEEKVSELAKHVELVAEVGPSEEEAPVPIENQDIPDEVDDDLEDVEAMEVPQEEEEQEIEQAENEHDEEELLVRSDVEQEELLERSDVEPSVEIEEEEYEVEAEPEVEAVPEPIAPEQHFYDDESEEEAEQAEEPVEAEDPWGFSVSPLESPATSPLYPTQPLPPAQPIRSDFQSLFNTTSTLFSPPPLDQNSALAPPNSVQQYQMYDETPAVPDQPSTSQQSISTLFDSFTRSPPVPPPAVRSPTRTHYASPPRSYIPFPTTISPASAPSQSLPGLFPPVNRGRFDSGVSSDGIEDAWGFTDESIEVEQVPDEEVIAEEAEETEAETTHFDERNGNAPREEHFEAFTHEDESNSLDDGGDDGWGFVDETIEEEHQQHYGTQHQYSAPPLPPPPVVSRVPPPSLIQQSYHIHREEEQAHGEAGEEDAWGFDENGLEEDVEVEQFRAPAQHLEDRLDSFSPPFPLESASLPTERYTRTPSPPQSPFIDDSRHDSFAWGDDDDGKEPPVEIVTSTNSRRPAREQRAERRQISVRSKRITAIAEEVLSQASELSDPRFPYPAFSACASPLVGTLLSIMSLYRAIAPVQYATVIAGVPALGMQSANDYEWIGDEIEIVWNKFVAVRGSSVVQHSDAVSVAVKRMRALGSEARDKQISIQEESLMEILDDANRFLNTTNPASFSASERAINQVTHTLERLALVWKPIMNPTAFYTTFGSLVNSVLSRVLTEIEDQLDISADESIRLNSLCKALHGLESLFSDDGGETSCIGREVPVWFKFVFLSELLEASMADILYLFDHGHLIDFSVQEIAKLVRALFSDSPLRTTNLEHILRGHPDVVAGEDEEW